MLQRSTISEQVRAWLLSDKPVSNLSACNRPGVPSMYAFTPWHTVNRAGGTKVNLKKAKKQK